MSIVRAVCLIALASCGVASAQRSPFRPEPPSPAFEVEVRDEDGGTFDGAALELVDLDRLEFRDRPLVLARGPIEGGRARFPVDALAAALDEQHRLGRPRRLAVRMARGFAGAPSVAVPAETAAGARVALVVPRAVAWVWRPAEIEVLDASGRPAPGVGVSFEVLRGAEWLAGGGGDATGEDGRARLWPMVSERYPLEEQSVRVVPSLALRDPPTVAIGPGPGPFVLRLPETVALEVEIAGSAPAELTFAAITLVDVPGSYAAAEVVAGRARFPHVEPGVALELALHVRALREPIQLPLEPLEHGAVRCVRHVVLPALPRIRWRAVGAEDPAASVSSVRAVVRCRDRGGRDCAGDGSPEVRGEPDGTQSMPVAMPWDPGHERWVEIHRWYRRDGQPDEHSRRARFDLSFALDPGAVHDLGEVRLEREPVLVSGSVRGPSGNPVEGAGVSVYPDPSTVGADGRHARPWLARTDAGGRFEVRGTCTTDRLVVRARVGEVEVERRGVPRDEDVALELALPATGELAVRVLLGEGVPGAKTRLVVIPRDAALRPRAERGRGGSLSFHGYPSCLDGRVPPHDFSGRFPAGRYDLELRWEQALAGPALARVEDVEIASGATGEPVRLLDARGDAVLRRLRLVTPEGAPLTVVVGLVVAGFDCVTATDEDGRLELVLPATVAEITLEPRGHERVQHVFATDPETRRCVPLRPPR